MDLRLRFELRSRGGTEKEEEEEKKEKKEEDKISPCVKA